MLRTTFIAASVLACAGIAPVRADPLTERCAVMVQSEAGIRTDFVAGFAVIGATPPLQLPAGYDQAAAIMCDRSVLIISDDDYRVITDLAVPLYISSAGRTIVLEISNGQFRARTVRGELTETEIAAVQAALNRAQSMIQGESP